MPANYTLIEKITVGAAGASSITFSGIPQTGYTDLVVRVSARTTRSAAVADNLLVQFNGSATGFTYKRLGGDGSGASSQSYSSGYLTLSTPTALTTANTFGNAEIYIPNYTSANYKSVSIDGVGENNAVAATMDLNALLWSNTAAITSIALVLTDTGTNFVQYSTFYLYGVAKLGTTPAIVPYATGGNTIMTDGTYWYHTFISSGTFTPAKALSVDYLVVAGGGGGSGRAGGASGGSGAGGYRLASGFNVIPSTNYTVTIGAGGAGSYQGVNGSNSVFSTITSTGGGVGAYSSSDPATTGGSGGGGNTVDSFSGAAGTSGQGNSGGTGKYPVGGGGGGAGAAGQSPTGNVGGTGGIGIQTSISGTATYYAGGGGGAAFPAGGGTAGGAGGAGGGGNGGLGTTSGTAGTANTGGGAGGSDLEPSTVNGGSGIVIVRYLV